MRLTILRNLSSRSTLFVCFACFVSTLNSVSAASTFSPVSTVELSIVPQTNRQSVLAASESRSWPTSEVVLREFAPPEPDWLPGHRGLDLAPGGNGEVRTPTSGVVVWRGIVGSIPVLVVRHGVARATYQPILSDLTVGTIVHPNQVLGVLASGGHCSQRCLHWGLKLDDRYLDPRLLLKPPAPVLVVKGNSAGKRKLRAS